MLARVTLGWLKYGREEYANKGNISMVKVW